MSQALKELEQFLVVRIAEARDSERRYKEALMRVIEMRDGLERSLEALRTKLKE